MGDTIIERESEIDQQAQSAIKQVKMWQKTQKNIVYRPIVKVASGTDINRYSINRLSSKVDMLGNSECKRLPSIKGIKNAMFQLEELEGKCMDLCVEAYQKPLIEPIEVVIGKQKK